jgi:hypothetical protein
MSRTGQSLTTSLLPIKLPIHARSLTAQPSPPAASNIAACIARATGSLRPLGNEALWRVADVLLLKQIARGPKRGAGICWVCGGGVVGRAHPAPLLLIITDITLRRGTIPALRHTAPIKDKRLAVDSPPNSKTRPALQLRLHHPGQAWSLDADLPPAHLDHMDHSRKYTCICRTLKLLPSYLPLSPSHPVCARGPLPCKAQKHHMP